MKRACLHGETGRCGYCQQERELARYSGPGICQWFAMCTNRANGTLSHPILGDVPICDRCRSKDAALGGS
jgi:hypothetical protein